MSAAVADQTPVFLDVETTGLSASAGTFVILVGIAFFQGDGLVVRQYFLPEPGVEPDLLAAVAEGIAGSSTLVTFNGKCFDAPMLAGRYHLHRRRDPLPAHHLDLLFPARRIWRRRLGQCNLATLEARVLGVVRLFDVPSFEIPRRYFDYLRDGRWELIAPVLDHNRQDLVSLARLALRVDALLRHPPGADSAAPSDFLGVGWLLEGLGRRDAARACYELALAGASSADRAEALHRLAVLAHRDNEVQRAVELYEVVATYPSHRATTASVELAKLYERKLADPERALVHARRALQLVTLSGRCGGQRALDPIRRQVDRLERKTGSGTTSDRIAPRRSESWTLRT